MKPEGLSRTEGEERAYRRGFDQGMNVGLLLAGLTQEQIQALNTKRLVEGWRTGRLKLSDPMNQLLAQGPASPNG
jgi:hypothetical protein